MGASAPEYDSSSENTDTQAGQEYFDIRKVPSDQYTCPECASVPEIVKLMVDTNEIEIKCKEHGKRRMFLKEYFKNEFKHLYCKSLCSVCQKCQETVPELFKFCYDCRKIFCTKCIKDHLHKSLVNVNEVNNRCSRHFDKKSKYYCKKCDVNVCNEDDDPKHKLKVIKEYQPDPLDIEKIKKKNDYFRKEKKLLDCLIKITDTVVNTYQKNPHNYWHSLNVTRLAASIEGRKDNTGEKKLNTLNIEYKITNATNKLRIFGAEFVKNNKDKVVLNFNGKEEEKELTEFYPGTISGSSIFVKLTEKESLTNMGFMFNDCTNLYSVPDFDQWDMYNVTNLSHLFTNCSNLEELPNIAKWDTTAVTDISYFFSGCLKLLNLPDISEWKTGSVSFMNGLFAGCSKLNYIPDISRWDTSYVTYMSNMFEKCYDLQQMPDISRWKTSNVLDFSSMFKECTSLPSLPNFSKWDTSNCINMSSMFLNCFKIKKLPNLKNWNVSKVTDLSHMFDGCPLITQIPDISGWITCSCENMSGLFNKCSGITDLPDISNWITHKVKDFSCMFCNCSSLNYFPDLSRWTTDNVTDMNHLFDGCKLVQELPDISGWNTSNVTNMGSMFYYCEQLMYLPDISRWDISKVVYSNGMFDGCSKLDQSTIPKKFR